VVAECATKPFVASTLPPSVPASAGVPDGAGNLVFAFDVAWLGADACAATPQQIIGELEGQAAGHRLAAKPVTITVSVARSTGRGDPAVKRPA